MTQDDSPNHRAPSLGGNAAHRSAHNEPSLSLDRLLPGLREALESSDRGQRLETIEQIIDSGSAGIVPLLIELLQDVIYTRSRQRIAAMLGQVGDARAVGPLAGLFDDADPGLRKVAAWALGQIGAAEAVDALLVQLERESNPQAAGAIILALGKIGDLKALPALLRISEDNSKASLASVALTALKTLGPTCSLTQVIEMLYSDDERLCHWAENRFVDRTGVPQMEHLPLLEKLLSYQGAEVRHKALCLLGALEDKQARDIVLQTLTHPDELMRVAACQAVREHRIREARNILISRDALETPRVREAIFSAMNVICDLRIVPFLLHIGDWWYDITPQVVAIMLDIAHNSTDEDERCKALEWVCADQHPEAIPDLVDILYQDSSVLVEHQAISALRRGFNAQAELALRAFMAETDNEALRAGALEALLSHEVSDASTLLLEQLEHIKDEEALVCIVRYLYLLGNDAGFSVMERLYRTSQSKALRGEVISWITCVKHADVVPLVIEALKNDSSPDVRSSAIHKLCFMDSDRQIAAEAFIDALTDTGCVEPQSWSDPPRVCDMAANCLEHIGIPEAMAALAAWRSTQEPDSEPTGN